MTVAQARESIAPRLRHRATPALRAFSTLGEALAWAELAPHVAACSVFVGWSGDERLFVLQPNQPPTYHGVPRTL